MAPKRATEAAIYCRISSDPQGERAGVERQRKDCEALADKLGVTVARVYTDNDVSAYSGKRRPEFEAMLTDAANGDFQVVIVWATDRLYRRMTDLTRITEELAPHARIASVNGGEIDLESSEGILRAQVLGSVAEFESRRKSERLAARAKQRAHDGRMTASNRPFGWAWATPCPGGSGCEHNTDCGGERPRRGSRGGLVLDPRESAELAVTYKNMAAGATLRAETKRLREAGMNVRALRAVLLSPRNAGLVAHRGQIVAEATNETALIDVETFNTVTAILNDPARRTSPGRPANTILGGGLLVCGLCGGNVAAGRRRALGTYICTKCRGVSRIRAAVDEPVLDLVGNVVSALAEAGALNLPAHTDDATTRLRASVAADEAKLNGLAALMAAGDLDPRDYAKTAKIIRANITIATTKLAKLANRPALNQLNGDVAGAWAARREQAQDGNVDWMRAALRELLDSIELGSDKVVTFHWKPGLGPLPNRIDVRPTNERTGTRDRRNTVKEMTLAGVSGVKIAETLGVNRSSIVKDLRILRAAGELPAGPQAVSA